MWYLNIHPRGPTLVSYEKWKEEYDKRVFYFNLFIRNTVDKVQREKMMDDIDKLVD